jgi:hypothetical protein
MNFNLYIFPLCQCEGELKVPDLKELYVRFPKWARNFVTPFLGFFVRGLYVQGLYKLGTLCYKGLNVRGLYMQGKMIGVLALGDSKFLYQEAEPDNALRSAGVCG